MGVDVRRERERRGLSQRLVADFVGCSQSYICMIESGKRKVSVSMAKRLAKMYGMKWYDFFE